MRGIRITGGRLALVTCLVLWALISAARPGLAAPMFPDVPDMWAADAVRALSAKGVLEGYPDGTFKGDRAATRFEVAMVVARLLAKMEQEHATFASRADLDELRRLANSLKDELDALGVRVQNLEDQVIKLDRRVSELERITFYGSFRAIGVSQHVVGAPLIGTISNPAVDFTNGRLIFDGIGQSGRMLLGLQARLNDDMTCGMEVAGYVGAGNALVDQYWGVTPPYNSNPFTAQSTLQPDLQGATHQPFTRMTLDRFWLHDRGNGYDFVMGSWHPKNVGDYLLSGIRNPNINSPGVLPFWGFQVTPHLATDKVQYEFNYSRLPIGALNTGWLGSASARYDFGIINVGASIIRMSNDQFSNGLNLPGGLIPMPTANNVPLVWRDSRTGNLTHFVGPQDETMFGADFNLQIIDKMLSMRGKWAHSVYNPDKTRTVLDATARGDLFNVGLTGKIGQFTADLDYLQVSPTYDTIMLPYATDPSLPVFLPYGSWYSSHYQLHDYLKYPTNRQGGRFTAQWDGGSTKAFGTVESFTQNKATTFAQLTTPGNAEPLFPLLQTPGAAQRGSTLTWGLGGSHKFDNGLRLGASFYNYKLMRGGAAIDNLDLEQNFWRFQAGYPLGNRFDIAAHYTMLSFTGHSGLTNQSFDQSIPGIDLNWYPARNMYVTLGARLLNLSDHLALGNSWHGNQFILDFNVDF